MPGERIGVGAKCHVNAGECRGMPGECKEVGVMCQGNEGECRENAGEYQGNVTEWVQSAM